MLGAGLVVAAVHGGYAGDVAPVRPAAVTVEFTAPHAYQPPAAPVAALAAKVTVHADAPAPRAVRRAATRVAHTRPHPRSAPPSRPAPYTKATTTSYTSALMRAVSRIPTYRAGTVRWVVSRAYAFWGTADWYRNVMYVSPDVPRSKLYDVAVHEWSHELSVLDYAGDVSAATAAMNAWFGGTGLIGPERAADCMSILQGATWTHYTTCTDAHWRAGAKLLVAGKPL